jgi:hypothetical protein
MIDNTKFDYTPLDTPNLLIRSNKDVAPPEMVLHPFLAPLVEKVMKAQPLWKAVIESSYFNGSDPRQAYTFRFYADNEELGTLSMGRNNKSNYVFELDNHRLKASRERGWVTTTIDPKKAFKIITKDFAPRSMAEHLAEASKKISCAVSAAASMNMRPGRDALTYLAKPFQHFAEAHWEAFCKSHSAKHIPTSKLELLDTFPELSERADAASDMNAKHNRNTGHYVVLQGSDYIVSQLDKKHEAQTLTSDKLSEYMRTRIGLLKLVEDGQFIAGVGVRTNATMFYIVPEEITVE